MIPLDARFRFSGERRQVTALFYDIVGSTELLMRSEPEQFFHSVTALHQAAEVIVKRHGGFLHQRLGDGGCCFFGYPDQSEDAAESAVLASLEVLTIGRKSKSKAKKPFRLRVGVATSLVVLSAEGDEIIGTAPVLAARLQAEADPDCVLVADSTFQLTRHRFRYSLLREAKLKGFDQPIPLWIPEKLEAPSSSGSAADEGLRPILGRDKEIASLLEAWNAARDGAGGSLAIVGEAGIGKSRLIAELRGRLGAEEHEHLTFQCHRRSESQPLHPFIGYLTNLVGPDVLSKGDARTFKRALEASGRRVDTQVADTILTFTADRSGVPSGNIKVSDLSGRAFRQQMIEAAVQIICRTEATAVPQLIVFEDAHWADGMTLELVDRLSAIAKNSRVLVVQTSRLRRSLASSSEISLSGLASSAVRDLVASIWDGKPPLGLSEFILEQCDGMPLYAEELAGFFRGKQSQGRHPSQWRGVLLEGGVSSLNDLLSARLASTGSARRVAQFASVIGREFSLSLLAYLMAGVSRRTVEADLDRLVSQGILERSPITPEAYQFRHVLMQEAAYSSLLKTDRKRIHQRIADLLISEETPSLPAAVSAWQCAEAGRHDDAAKFALAAAEACVLRSAMHEANVSLDLCARELGSVSTRHPDRIDLTLGLLKLQGVVATALEGEGSESARKIYSRAMQLLRKQPVDDREEHFPLYWGWWFTAPNILTQQSRARILVEDMQAARDPEAKLQSYHCGWATSFHAGEHNFCLECVSKGLELYNSQRAVRNRAFFGGHDAKVCGLGESALSYLLLNETDASETAIQQCLEWADTTEHIGSLVHGLYYAIVLRRCQSRYDDVHALGEKMLSLAEEHGLAASKARANMYCGWAELMSTSGTDGATRFQDALRLQEEFGTDDNLSIHSDMHAQVLQRLGKIDEALSIVQNAIDLGRKSGQWFWLAELHRQSAELRLGRGDKAFSVKNDLTRAVRIAQDQGAAWLLQRAKSDLSRNNTI